MGGQVHCDGKEGVRSSQDHQRLSGAAHDKRRASARKQSYTGASFPHRIPNARYLTGDVFSLLVAEKLQI